ncbi:nucleotide exchange factor GrpE [Agromyces seonyuensis]|uniref:Protein GrpE n=1 Tax=Agromyces seonyuensis TaxID=2662446 RepID=A0A6I4NTZ7_9MICO|nr:nucleotide exchange factor GrpE [Agromyces seonyuensis]MWB97916.1 nucleotide exchange factor GrpE [Agromyces seonyuensis]
MTDEQQPVEPEEEGTPGAGAPASDPSTDDATDAATEATEDASDAQDAGDDELYVEDILNAAETEAAEPSDEHLADLKRLTAEYANYRRRTEANREVEKERAIGSVVSGLLPVLDDLDRAEKHGDLEADSPFATIAAKFRSSMERLGLEAFGEVGEAFDPQQHEAIAQFPKPDAEGETVLDVVERGYRLGSVQLRAAKVVVAVPA